MKKLIYIFLATFCINNIIAYEANPEVILSSISEDKFVDVIQYLLDDSIKDYRAEINHSATQMLTLEVAVNSNQIFVKSSKPHSIERNYNIPVSQTEKDDLTYITTTLARSSLPSLATSSKRTALKKAGDRIDHLHPLRFLMTVFTDEELKANITAIRTRDWVWGKFYEGLEGSLKEESRKDNMRNEFVADFATIIGIDVSLIQPSIQEKRWKEFVNILIDVIPRSGNPGRYDM